MKNAINMFEKVIICKNEEDTKRMFQLIEENIDINLFRFEEVIVKKDFTIKHRAVKVLDNHDVVESCTLPPRYKYKNFENIIHWEEPVTDGYEAVADEINTVWLDDVDEITFKKNQTVIKVAGHYDVINDLYSLLGIEDVAFELLKEIYDSGDLREPLMLHNKINMKLALPIAEEFVTKTFLSEKDFEIIESAKFIQTYNLVPYEDKFQTIRCFENTGSPMYLYLKKIFN